MTDTRYYLSDKDLSDRLEQMPGEGTTDCGGWTFDPPCGGCDRCIRDQQVYYFMRERDWARKVQAAGLELADPNNIAVSLPWGGREQHDAYACFCSDEIKFPSWTKIERVAQ